MTMVIKYLLLSAQIILCLLTNNVHAWMASPSPKKLARITTTRRIAATTTATQLQSTKSSNSNDPMEKARQSLEMHWNFEESKQEQECVVEDPSTCGSDTCQTCRGEGDMPCRFCRGTTQMYVGSVENKHGYRDDASLFQKCPVCQEGHEMCTSCRGTGWIAEWTRPTLEDDEEELHGSHGGGTLTP